MISRKMIVIELGRRRLRAVLAMCSRGAVTVERVLGARVPTELNLDDAQAVGAWVGRQLSDGRFPTAPVTIALSREHAVVKRVTLPSTVDDELPGMTRLAVQRDLPFAAEAAVIDFVAVRRDATSTTVMAAAIEQKRLAFAREMAQAAGLRVQRVSLRCMGTAALVTGLGPARPGVRSAWPLPNSSAGQAGSEPAPGVLAVEVAGEGVEFTVVSGGGLRFSRGADVPELDDALALAEAVVMETRRTWLSYGASEEPEAVSRVLVLGDEALGLRVAAALADIVRAPAEVLTDHPAIRGDRGELTNYWSLAALALEQALGAPTIDFARPRQAPDRAARRRQLVLGALGLGIVAFFGSWTVGHLQYRSLRERADDLVAKANYARTEFNRFRRDQDKLSHLRQWEQINVDWLAHALRLEQASPPPTDIVLDSWIGSLNTAGVKWDKSTDKWLGPMEVKILLDGEAKSLDAAVAFRKKLVEDETYVTFSVGSDSTGGRRLPHSFAYQLQTAQPAPGATPDATLGANSGASPGTSSGTTPGAEAPGGSSAGGGQP